MVLIVSDQLVDGGDVEVHLAGELCLEGSDLEIDDHEASSLMVVEEKAQDELLAADLIGTSGVPRSRSPRRAST